MLKKIIKKDVNEELERILDEKQVNEQARNLLQGILYKIEVSYKDYQKVKGITQTEDEYIEKLILNIKKKCNKINVVKLSQKLADEEVQKELKKNKFYVNEQEVVSYPIEERLLYAIEKKSNNRKILNNKYKEATIAVSDIINMGKNIDRVEVLRDFNGWSWTTINKEIENIDANLIYQTLQILFGKEFLDNWCEDKDGIIDYFEILDDNYREYGENQIKEIKNLMIKLAIVNDIKENKEFSKNMTQKLKKLREELKKYEDTEAHIETISNNKKQAMKKLKDIEKILGQEERLKAEYKKRNKEAPLEKKIFNINKLKKELEDQRKVILNDINENNYLLNPMNYVQEKKEIEQQKNLIEIIEIDQNKKEEMVVEYLRNFLSCLDIKIKEETQQENILKMIYQFRYFMLLPFDENREIKDVEQLKKDILKTEKILVKKAIENRVIVKAPFEVIKHLFTTRIIVLENIYYKINKKEEKYYVQIFDENTVEEKFQIKVIGESKINKKIKIFI